MGISPLGSHVFLDEFALAYHRAVAERLRAEPEAVLERARRNLNRWTEGDAFRTEERVSLEEWQQILGEADADRLIKIITDTSDEGQHLRSSSPFIGALSPEERRRYSPPVNKEQLFDLTERVKLVAGIDFLSSSTHSPSREHKF